MWPLLREYVAESLVVSLDEAARAMKTTADRVHVIAEGAAACAVAAALSPAFAARGHRKVVAVVSGGNIDLARFASLVGACADTK
jgi:threonine dehydratase